MNYGQSGSNTDELISSGIDLSSLAPTDAVTLSFRYAYRKRISSNTEWLKVFISKDCGDNWVQRKTLSGNSLSSLTSSSSWVPQSQEDWVTIHMVNVTSDYFVQPFRFKFEFEGSGGNNFYLDDINLYQGSPSNEVVLETELLGAFDQLTVYPNPTDGDLHVSFSSSLQSTSFVSVCDLAGKEIERYPININSGKNLVVIGTAHLAKGTYFISIGSGHTPAKVVVR